MPVEVVKYLCQFKCGTKAKSKIEQINHHESICWKNPDCKSCSTCKHEIYEHDGDGYRSWMNRGCKIMDGQEFDELHAKCGYNTTPVLHIQPIRDCDKWESK